jgi:hypothetical protein
MKPPQIIHLTSAPGELWHKDITVEVMPQEQILLWPILSHQHQHYTGAMHASARRFICPDA